MEKIEKMKQKFPVGSIIKHKCCNLMYEIIDYEYKKGYKNYYGYLLEEFVVLKTLYFPKEKIGQLNTFDMYMLREFNLSNINYLNKLLKERKEKELKESKIEKYEQLTLF